jgi:hypothetical protein
LWGPRTMRCCAIRYTTGRGSQAALRLTGLELRFSIYRHLWSRRSDHSPLP